MNLELSKKIRSLWADRRPYAKRLRYSGAAAAAFCFTFLFFGPLEMVAFGGDLLNYNYLDVVLPLALMALAVFGAGAALIALLKGRIFNYAVSLVVALTLGGYLQGSLLNGSLGTLNGETVDWSLETAGMVLNLLIWMAVIIAVFFVLYLHRNFWKKTVLIVSLLLVVMQLAPAIGILTGAYADARVKKTDGYSLTTDGMYEYSAADNIFVFVLDYMDFKYLERIMEEEPAFFEKLDGFTGYTNAMSTFSRTLPGLNNILTGYTKDAYLIGSEQYFANSWNQEDKHLLKDLTEAGYRVELYAGFQYLFGEPENAMPYVANAINQKADLNYPALLKKMVNLSAYRYAPIAMKPFFWTDTKYYNDGVMEKVQAEIYATNDAKYAPGFLTATAEREEKTFKFYHFYGSHSPYNLNRDGTVSSTPTDVVSQTMGCFHNLYGAFDRMKELGIYEDATILITSDHGDASTTGVEELTTMQIGMFYKPAGSADTPLVWSDAQVGNTNVPAMILKAAGADHSNYGTPLDEIGEEDDIVRTYYRCVVENVHWDDDLIQVYEVTGEASDIADWNKLDTYKVKVGFYS